MELLTAGLMVAAAAADGATGSLPIGDIVVGVLGAIFAAGGGIWIGRDRGERAAKKSWTKREAEIRAEIANDLRAKITNDPLHVQQINDCVSVKECNRKMDALSNRVTELEKKVDSKFDKILDTLSAMDDKSEARSVALHRRMDAFVERSAK